MVGEAGIAVAFFVLGYATTRAFSTELPSWVTAWLAYPIGVAVWLLASIAILAVRFQYYPRYLLPVLLGIAIVAMIIRHRRSSPSRKRNLRRDATPVAVAGVTVVTVAGISALVNLSAMTNDAYWMLRQAYTILSTHDILGPPEFLSLRSFPLGVALVQIPASFVGRDYLASPPTVLGVTGLLALLNLGRVAMRDLAIPAERSLRFLVAGGCFLLTSFFIVFQLFYIRGNLESGVYAALAVVSLWLSARTGRSTWAIVGTVALTGSILFRVENPIFLLPLVVVAISTRAIPRTGRLALLGTFGMMAIGWYGGVLLPLGEGAVLDPVLLGLIAASSLGLAVLYLLVERGGWLGETVERYVGTLVLAGVGSVALAVTVWRPSWMGDVFLNIFRNVFEPGLGLWGVMWLLLVPLFIFAAIRPSLVHERIMIVPTVSYFVLVYVSGAFANIPHEQGWASSANRMLSVIVLVMFIHVLIRYAAEHGEAAPSHAAPGSLVDAEPHDRSSTTDQPDRDADGLREALVSRPAR